MTTTIIPETTKTDIDGLDIAETTTTSINTMSDTDNILFNVGGKLININKSFVIELISIPWFEKILNESKNKPIFIDKNPDIFEKVLHFIEHRTYDQKDKKLLFPELDYFNIDKTCKQILIYTDLTTTSPKNIITIHIDDHKFQTYEYLLRRYSFFDSYLSRWSSHYTDYNKYNIELTKILADIFKEILNALRDNNYPLPYAYRHYFRLFMYNI